MHVPHAGGVAAVDFEGIATAEHEMARVEAQADERGIGSPHQLVDFPRRFDEPGAVRMEDGAKACRVADRTRDRLASAREGLPRLVWQTVVANDASGARRPRAIGAAIVGQHHERRLAGGGQQTCRSHGRVDARRVSGRIGEPHRHESAEHA